MSSLEQELLAHGDGLRALARALVGAQHADDLIQDTVAMALSAPPRAPGPLGGWLATVANRIAGRHRRNERRRIAREQRAARPEALPAVDVELETRETLQRLTAAVMALPAPYQGAVLLRYLHAMTPREIARQSGESVATVKSRLQRGLVLLRERLDRERAPDWRGAFATVVGFEPAAASAALTGGLLAMGMGIKLSCAAAVAGVGLVLWWQLRESPEEPLPSAEGTVASSLVGASATHERAAGQLEPADEKAKALEMVRVAIPAFDRQQMAADFGLIDRGLLDSDAKAAVRSRLVDELAGTQKQLSQVSFDANPAQGWSLFTNLLKYEEALRQLDGDRYLTVDLPGMPKTKQATFNPMVLMGASQLDGKPVSILFPIELPTGSVIAWAHDNWRTHLCAAKDAAIATRVAAFNAEPLEVRTHRIEEMSAAQEEMATLLRACSRGEISQQEMFQRAAPLSPRQPPNGTVIDRATNTLRVR